MTRYIEDDLREQLRHLFDKFESSVAIELYLDESSKSEELHGYVSELASMTDRISMRIGDASREEHLPCARLIRSDGKDSGIAFHGVPGGHEFTSFALALFNAAGPGQMVDDDDLRRIREIDFPIDIKIFVTLSCKLCPDTVAAAQKIAAENDLVSAEAYDIAVFPELRKELRVMSVPCLMIGGGELVFGRKSLSELLDVLVAQEHPIEE